MAPPRTRGGAAPGAPRVPVLSVEDEPAIVELLGAILADLPADITAARSVAQALALLPPAGRRPALITLDIVLPDGDGFQILAEIRRRRELDDVPVLMLSAQTDMTTQKRAYAAGASDFIGKPFSIEMLDAKVRAWLRLSRLAAQPQKLRDLAHEARNPLSAIGAAAQIIARPDADEALRRRLARAIEGEADRLARMLAQLESQGASLPVAVPPPIDVRAVLREIADFNVADPAARARLHVPEGAGDGAAPALCRVDGDRLRQMLLNLIDNALAATASGGEVFVEVDGAGPGGLRVAVRDSGFGVAAENLPRLFEDGFTTRGGASRGLGLGITRRLCQAAGGRIEVVSAPGQGATFTLHLPR